LNASPVRSKPTFSIPSHFSQAKNDFFRSKPLYYNQNHLPPVKTNNQLPLYQGDLTTSIQTYSSQAKFNSLHSKVFQ
jgi:hypothetical protein